jgi:DNA anti-recombination protein RmuC
MGLLPDRIERINKRIATIEAQLDDISTALTERLTPGKGHVSGYEFDSGHGKQKMTFTRVSDYIALQEKLQAELERLYRQKGGTGLHSITMRRKGGV